MQPPQLYAPVRQLGPPGNGFLPYAATQVPGLLGGGAVGPQGRWEGEAVRAPRAGPRMVLAVCAALCEEGSHRSGRVHERKELLDSETLAVGGQDAD